MQIAALAGTGTPGRAIQWDLIELGVLYADGRTDTCRSSCLPCVETGANSTVGAGGRTVDRRLPRQFAEISTGSR